jgi:hypothetical protein
MLEAAMFASPNIQLAIISRFKIPWGGGVCQNRECLVTVEITTIFHLAVCTFVRVISLSPGPKREKEQACLTWSFCYIRLSFIDHILHHHDAQASATYKVTPSRTFL